ncbi:MAG: quinolinate synthase NadA [Candidatus Latescibacteria bacterium]|nr:quinolinate synthase NadA [Candidatus Latescibacterota bacterium]
MNIEDYEKLSKRELVDRIEKAKKEKNAVILAHNYQILEVQHVADHLGDSLGLSRLAAKTDADMVVFCGVDFMAESAKILAPGKKVLIPEIEATCPMARMVTPDALRKAKAERPDAVVLAYVNTTADVKALTDICCTSANSVAVVNSLGDREIIFVPDRNLADYTKRQTGASIVPWQGYCYVHNFFTVEDVERERAAHPGAVVLIHPEAPPGVVALADHVFSTSGMARYVADISGDPEKKRGVIIGTEVGLVEQLREKHPDVAIMPLNMYAVCGTMKMTTLAKVCRSIETDSYEVTVPPEVAEKARASLERMIGV